MNIYIYTLKDPINNGIRYVGQTNNLKRRLARHITNSKNLTDNRHISNWIRSLNNLIIMDVIEVCDYLVRNEREKYWINYYKEKGFNLCNSSNGGAGAGINNKNCVGRVLSEKTKSKISKSNKGRKTTHGKGGGAPGKTIKQYSIKGELIASYSSILNASKITGICRRTIYYSLKANKKRQRHQFIWKYL